jgi:hypothetical protein
MRLPRGFSRFCERSCWFLIADYAQAVENSRKPHRGARSSRRPLAAAGRVQAGLSRGAICPGAAYRGFGASRRRLRDVDCWFGMVPHRETLTYAIVLAVDEGSAARLWAKRKLDAPRRMRVPRGRCCPGGSRIDAVRLPRRCCEVEVQLFPRGLRQRLSLINSRGPADEIRGAITTCNAHSMQPVRKRCAGRKAAESLVCSS